MREETIEIGSKWQHFKGDVMTVMLIAKHTETLEEMVIYEHQGGGYGAVQNLFFSEQKM